MTMPCCFCAEPGPPVVVLSYKSNGPTKYPWCRQCANLMLGSIIQWAVDGDDGPMVDVITILRAKATGATPSEALASLLQLRRDRSV